MNVADFVASLLVSEIRAICYGQEKYSADVIAEPIVPDNLSHAVIVPDPSDASANFVKKRLQKLLAEMASVRISVVPESAENNWDA